MLRSDGAGWMKGFIPGGELCGANATVYDFGGFDLARDDRPVTHLTAGATIRFRCNKWPAHPGWFRSHITKDTWAPSRPLSWDGLEPEPFDKVQDPPRAGGPGSENSDYLWNVKLPEDKTGRHIIYSVWQRSDSDETFYNCSDVVFDGGNGEVTSVGESGTLPPPSQSPSPSAPASPQPGMSHRTTSDWADGAPDRQD